MLRDVQCFPLVKVQTVSHKHINLHTPHNTTHCLPPARQTRGYTKQTWFCQSAKHMQSIHSHKYLDPCKSNECVCHIRFDFGCIGIWGRSGTNDELPKQTHVSVCLFLSLCLSLAISLCISPCISLLSSYLSLCVCAPVSHSPSRALSLVRACEQHTVATYLKHIPRPRLWQWPAQRKTTHTHTHTRKYMHKMPRHEGSGSTQTAQITIFIPTQGMLPCTTSASLHGWVPDVVDL